MGLLIFFSAPFLSTLMGAAETIHSQAVSYIKIRSFGGPAVLITMTSFGILYGLADMRSPLFIAVTVNVLNIVLDFLLIFGAGPIPAMGIAGAAIASTVSQWLGVVMCWYVVRRKLGFTHRVDLSDIKRLITIGHNMILRTGSLILFLILATRSATQLGPESGAAHQAIRQTWIFTGLFLDASAVTAQSLVGYFFGSGYIGKTRRVSLLVCRWSFMIGVALMLLMVSGADFIASLLVPKASLFLFYPAWIVSAMFQPLAALAFVTDGIHWGTGDFRYLKNGVILATTCGALALMLLEMFNSSSLILIWWVTGGWVLIRAILGIVRIWPGTEKSPLRIR
ncbi:MAG: MATE family efflux transporter, partial [Desulforhopalus sp.]